MSAIDDLTDVPLSAVAALVRAAVRSDLGEDALVALYADPRSLNTITAGKFPALCVYRAREQFRQLSSDDLAEDITIAFDYVLPSTAMEKRAGRWPAMAAVWRSLARAVITGKHPAVESGAEVLVAAATQIVMPISAKVLRYDVAAGGSENYPFMRAEIAVTWNPADVDDANLATFLELYTDFDQPAAEGTDLLLGDILTLPGFGG